MKLSKVMSAITAVLYIILLGYGVAWYMGKVQGDFSLLLLILTLVTFAYWLFEKIYLRPQRVKQALAAEEQIRQQHAGQPEELLQPKIEKAQSSLIREPWWIEWTAGFFWVILIVFALRSFVVEPFRIPSGSMMPTLQAGDFILVNKYEYGIRLPVANTKIISMGEPQRGDVIVFRYPPDENIAFIKRIVGLPGDEVVYQNKRLTINGQEMPSVFMQDTYDRDSRGDTYPVQQYQERLGPVVHQIFINPGRPAGFYGSPTFPLAENCRYSVQGVICKVPYGQYFVMGDNRDNSEDSRYWGFVPQENIIGKAFFIWMNPGQLSRIGGFQ